MANSKDTNPNKYSLIFIIIGIMIAVGLFFLVRKTWDTYLKVNDERNQLESKVSATTALVSQKQTEEAAFKDLKNYFPTTEADIAALAAALESNAAGSGVLLVLNFDDFPERTPIAGSQLYGLNYTATVDGPYQAVTSWISRLETLPYFLVTNSTSVNLSAETTGVKAIIEGVIIMGEE